MWLLWEARKENFIITAHCHGAIPTRARRFSKVTVHYKLHGSASDQPALGCDYSICCLMTNAGCSYIQMKSLREKRKNNDGVAQ